MAKLTNDSDSSIGKEVLFDAVFGKASEGILLVTFEGLIEKANPSVSVMLGYSLSELERRSILELIHAGDRPEIQNLLEGKIDCIRAHRRFLTNAGGVLMLSIRTYLVHKSNEPVRVITFLWPIDSDPTELTNSIEARLQHMEEMLNKYGKPEEWKMVNNIHLGDDVGGDKSGRDKLTVTNSTKIFYFIAAVLTAIISLLAYIGYLVTFPSHGGHAVPPTPPQQHEQLHD